MSPRTGGRCGGSESGFRIPRIILRATNHVGTAAFRAVRSREAALFSYRPRPPSSADSRGRLSPHEPLQLAIALVIFHPALQNQDCCHAIHGFAALLDREVRFAEEAVGFG